MRTLSEEDEVVCNPGAVVFTMFLGVCLGVASAVVLAIGSHFAAAPANPQVAAPPLIVELMFSTFGAFLFSVAAVFGASLALGILDHRLQRPRAAQGIIAGVGAVLTGIGFFIYFGPTVTVGFSGIISILIFVAGASYTLTYIRSRAHTS